MKTVPISLTRRTALKSAAFGVAALSAPQIMVRAASAAAEMKGQAVPDFVRVKLGDFEITTISDGQRVSDGPHPTFGGNVDEAEMHALLRENNLPEKQTVFQFTPTLVNTGEQLVLFDTGLGAGAREGGMGQARSVLGKAGYTPEQVDVVILTHMHPDHIGGMKEADAAAYPNARYVTGQAEYDFWAAPERMSGPTERVAKLLESNVKPFADKMTFIGDGGEVVSGITGMAAFGHTPGHMIYNVESNGRRVVITADTANHFVASLQRPDWEVRFDADKAAAAQARKDVFGMLAADKVPFIGYHMPFPSIGYVEAMGPGFRYIPHSYQLYL